MPSYPTLDSVKPWTHDSHQPLDSDYVYNPWTHSYPPLDSAGFDI